MALSNVSFRMEEDLKEEMRRTCQELGMDMTTAFVIYAKKLFTLLLAGTIILTAGCGKTAPVENDPKEPADADAQN